MNYNGLILKTVKTIATAFNAYFLSVFTPPVLDLNDVILQCPWHNVNNFTIPKITPELVLIKELKALDPKTSNGSDNISVLFLTKCADVLSVPISNLFNSSLQLGVGSKMGVFQNHQVSLFLDVL